MNRVHSAASGSIPVQSDLAVIAELQALALAIRIVGIDNLDKVIVRPAAEPLSNPQQLEDAAHDR
ncbi:hypothetical protein [Brevundimonas diminuta]